MTITALESPRASITMLARHFGFDAVESGGRIRFAMRELGAGGDPRPRRARRPGPMRAPT